MTPKLVVLLRDYKKSINKIKLNIETGINKDVLMKNFTATIYLSIVALCLLTLEAKAHYNANISGVLAGVYVYTNGDYIYLKLKNQPTEHPSCKPTYFVIDGSVPYERRQMLLSRLLTAYATKEKVNLGYDKEGDCANGYIRVHKAG